MYQFILLFNSIGHVIPVRYLLGSFMCVQFFIGPVLAYNGLDEYQYFMYKMKVSEVQYFTYTLPAIVLFIVGLHLYAGNLKGEVVDQSRIAAFVQNNSSLPYFFIILGFSSSVIGSFFGSDLGFVFYLLGGFKFIGLFLLILGTKQLKALALILVLGSIISSSLGSGMFHDLLTWIIFIGAVFAIKYKLNNNIKLVACFFFIIGAVIIQVMKGSYREATSITGTEQAGIKTFSRLVEEKKENHSLLSNESLATSSIRINQGFIITNILYTVPERVPFSNGEQMYKLFEAGILPRIIAPNKLKAGDRVIFTKYSGIPLLEGTSMGLSSVGDAYLNFGVFGGCLFMFFLGILYSGILNMFYKYGHKYPILILFSALVFYYPIRPDCEFQTILGHLFKSLFLIYMILIIWKSTFYLPAGRLSHD